MQVHVSETSLYKATVMVLNTSSKEGVIAYGTFKWMVVLCRIFHSMRTCQERVFDAQVVGCEERFSFKELVHGKNVLLYIVLITD
jgi:hypothetical protein